MRSLRLPAGIVLLCIFTVILPCGCAKEIRWQNLSSPAGEKIRWKPVAPQLGDLIQLEVTGARSGLWGPDGIQVLPVNYRFDKSGKKLFWSFRIKETGDWSWGTSDKAQKLWSVATVAGDATEMKTIDAQSLWSGKKPAVTPAQDKAAP